jgi:hypothetical protein
MQIIIPIGDHCAAAICLRELGLRSAAFPFDWIVTAHANKLEHSNFSWIAHTILQLLHSPHTIPAFVAKLFAVPEFQPQTKINTAHALWFPHDNFDSEVAFSETVAKYVRRMTRLIQTLRARHPVTLLLVTRHHGVESDVVLRLLDTITALNPNSRLIWISGCVTPVIHHSALHVHVVPMPIDDTKDEHALNVTRRVQIKECLDVIFKGLTF